MSKRYSSDTSDKEWELIEKIINRKKGQKGHPPPRDARRLWDGIFYVTKKWLFLERFT